MCNRNVTIRAPHFAPYNIVALCALICLALALPAAADFGSADSPSFYLDLLTNLGQPSCGAADSDIFSLDLLGIRRAWADSRAFWHDGAVDTAYCAAFVSQWLASDCLAAEWCNGMDLDLSGAVDFGDFAFLAAYWLEGI